jgi:hypothetical protein
MGVEEMSALSSRAATMIKSLSIIEHILTMFHFFSLAEDVWCLAEDTRPQDRANHTSKAENRGLVLAAVPILTDAPMIRRMSIRICNVSSDGTRCWNADFVAGCQDGKLKYPPPCYSVLKNIQRFPQLWCHFQRSASSVFLPNAFVYSAQGEPTRHRLVAMPRPSRHQDSSHDQKG